MKIKFFTRFTLIALLAISLAGFYGCKQEPTEPTMEEGVSQAEVFIASQGSYAKSEVEELLLEMQSPAQKIYLLSAKLDYATVAEENENLLKDDPEAEAIVINGEVKDGEGEPIADAMVYLMNRDATMQTDAKGEFKFSEKVTVPQLVKVMVKKKGYGSMIHTADIRTSADNKPISIMLMPAEIVTVNIEAGSPAEVVYKGGKLTIPADSLVKKSDMEANAGLIENAMAEEAVDGEVTMEMTYLGPDDFDNNAELRNFLVSAVLKEDATREMDEATEWETASIRTFGMVDIKVYQDEEELQLKEGATATLVIEIPENMMDNFKGTFDIGENNEILDGAWIFNETFGVWENFLTAIFVEPNQFILEVPHFTYYNCDDSAVWGEWIYTGPRPAYRLLNIVNAHIDFSTRGASGDDTGTFCKSTNQDKWTDWDDDSRKKCWKEGSRWHYEFEHNFTDNGEWTPPVRTGGGPPLAKAVVNWFEEGPLCDDVDPGLADDPTVEWCVVEEDTQKPVKEGREIDVVTFTDVGPQPCLRPCE